MKFESIQSLSHYRKIAFAVGEYEDVEDLCELGVISEILVERSLIHIGCLFADFIGFRVGNKSSQQKGQRSAYQVDNHKKSYCFVGVGEYKVPKA